MYILPFYTQPVVALYREPSQNCDADSASVCGCKRLINVDVSQNLTHCFFKSLSFFF